MTNQTVDTLTTKIDGFEQDTVIGFKNIIDTLNEEIKSFNQEASEFKQLLRELNEEAQTDIDIAFDVRDIQERVMPLDTEITELNAKLANMSSLELLGQKPSGKEELESREEEHYNECLQGSYDLVIGGTELVLGLL
jgi:uncharacterized coiled-coil DUF342 family protein